ncbi:MAG: 50S ribosomal protein L29 [Anaerolineales bacterium]
MQANKLREFTTEELQHRLQETRRELFNLRQQWYAGSLIDKNAITAVRKDIARILTILRERELQAQHEKGGAA